MNRLTWTLLLPLTFFIASHAAAQQLTQLQQLQFSTDHHHAVDCAYEPDSAYLEQLADPTSAINQRLQQVTQTPLIELLSNKPTIKKNSILPELQNFAFEGVVRIPMVLHILRRDDGTGGAALSSVLSAVNTVNANYAPYNLQFEACNIRFVDSTALFNTQLFFPSSGNPCGDPSDGQQLAVEGRNLSGKINLYVAPNSTSRQAGNDGTLCTSDDMFPNRSWTWRPSNAGDNTLRQHIVLNNNSVSNGRTLGHELGHWLGLLHTHGSSNNRPAVGVETNELVDGSNCESAGDFVCDTPADPNLAGRVDTSCNYVANALLMDANGSPFSPNANNRMSYSRGMCMTDWSQGQGLRMQAGYLGVRDERGYNLRLHSCDIGYEAASFVSQSAPTSMLSGQRYSVSVTFRNSGRSTWSPGYRLISRQQGFNLFKNGSSTNAIVLARQVLPGESVTVSFQISAFSPGVYSYLWAIAKPFGQKPIGSGGGGNVEVTVAGQSTSCADLNDRIAELQQSVRDLQAELHGASPSEKVFINQQVKAARAQIDALKRSKAQAGCA